METCEPADTPMVRKSKMDEHLQGKAVDPTRYHGMIGTLMYLTASRPDLAFVVCMCARYQAKPTEKHLNAVKRIFKYLRGTVNRGLWYPNDSSIALAAYAHKSAAISSTEAEYIALSEQVGNGVVELYFVNTEYQLANIFTKALGKERIEFLINKLGMRSFTPETLKQLQIRLKYSGALDDALVPREQRLRIGNCNYRLSTTFKPKEPTFHVALDVLSLIPFHQAFLISGSVPAIYMHEFRATVSYHKHCIKFKMNKKSYSFDLETFRDMLQICPNLPGQKFKDHPFEEEIISFIRELGYPGDIKSLSDVK
ncbi:hypothetical protein Tco_1364644, partial [Tanacetum coccineum]